MASCIDRLWIIVFLLFWLVPGVVLAKLLEKKISFLACLKRNVIGYVIFGLIINLGVSVIFFLIPRPVDKILRITYLVGGLIWGIILLWRARHDIRLRVDWWLLALGMGLLAGQLCFSNQLILPSNTDSITHYRYIVQFLNWREEGLGLFEFIRRLRFYHYGFHLLVSEIHVLSGFAITDIMVSFGTILTVLAPFTVMLPLERFGLEKKCQRWAVFGIALATLFPGFAQNWGKYPALLSVVLLPLPVSLILDMAKNENKSRLTSKIFALMLTSILVGLAHWRSLVVLAVIGLAVYFYYDFFKQRVPVWVLVPMVAGVGYFLLNDRARFNVTGGQVIFWLVLIAIAIGVMVARIRQKSPNKLALSLIMYLGVRLCVEISLAKVMPQFGSLVDMPYFRIVSFILAGLFLGSLFDEIRKLHSDFFGITELKKRYLADLIVLIIASLLLIAIPVKRKWTPATAYIMVGAQQKEVVDWALDAYQGQNMKLLLAGIPLLDYVEYADAGGWLAEMGGFDVVFAIEPVDLNRADVQSRLCREAVDLIFIDASRHTVFSPKVIPDQSLYDKLYEAEDVRIIAPKCAENN